MLAEFGWAESTWANRLAQVRKWLTFCDEDGRDPLPAEEGDVLAFIGYLALEGRVGPQSVRQYVSAVSRYHVNHGFASPTLTDTVRDLMAAYARKSDRSGSDHLLRAGCPASLMKKVLEAGLAADDPSDVGCCAMTVFAFIFQCRAVTVAHLQESDMALTAD